MFPVPFGEETDDFLLLQVKDTILRIDEILADESDERLDIRRQQINHEIKEKLKPVDVTQASISRIRNTYVDWKNALILEGFPVTNQTSCVEFWQFVRGYKEKYKTTQTNGPTE